MTNENAIKWLKDILKNGDFSMPQYEQALEHHDEFMKRSYEQGKVDALSQEPCDDAIDREYLFKVLDDFCGHDRTATITLDTLADLVYDMPPITQKSGKWIEQEGWDGDVYYECSVCGEPFCLIDGTPTDNMYNYCPNCGAKMESEDK